jgi:putative ABC transport system substrate-binding protein
VAPTVTPDMIGQSKRPASHTTGFSILNVELMPKWLGLLRQLAPQARRLAALANPQTAFTPAVVKSLQANAAALGMQVNVFRTGTDSEIEAAFADISQQPGGALLLGPALFSPVAASNR